MEKRIKPYRIRKIRTNKESACHKEQRNNSLCKKQLKKFKLSKIGRKPGKVAAERAKRRILLENSHNFD